MNPAGRRTGRLALLRSISLCAAALAACSGGGSDAGSGAGAAAGATPSAAAPVTDPLSEHFWLRADSSAALGSMLAFVSDGTLLHDSCGETYRLSRWERHGTDTLSWSEDGIRIDAVVTGVSDTALGLKLLLRGGAEEQRFRAAPAPYVCPDLRTQRR